MKKFLLSIFAVLFAFVGAQADEYYYTFSAKQFTANGTKTLGNVDWTLAGDGGFWGYDGTKGQQFGSGGAPYKSMTFSTSGISGTITKIVVNTSGANDIAATARVTVGGANFGEVITLTNTATAYTFTGTASGDIVLSYTQTSSKAIYIKSISVTYTTGDSGEGEGGGVTPDPETPVTPPAEGEVVDVINIQTIGIDSYGSYTSWTGVQSNSSAVYAGQSHKNGDAVQLKSKDSTSGIVTTKSGGKAKKIVVEWNGGTESGRTLDVYGKNSAYSAATELYSSSTQGTKIGSIVCGTSTELTISEDYEYIGLRSKSGAMYLTSVSITWDTSAGVTVVPDAPALPEAGDFVTSMNFEIANVDAYEDGTTVYYSIGGGDFKEYTTPFPITTTSEIVAYAEKDGKKSAEVRAEYTRIAYDPEINVLGDADADAFEGSIEVEITTENGAVAYYTLNGEEPTIESTKYADKLTIKATATLKVIAVEEGEYRSKNVVDKTFTMALNDTSVDVDANSVTFDATAQGYEDKEVVASANITDGISVLFDKGTNSNTTKYYVNGEAIRSYGGSYFIVESTVGTIIKIVLTYGSGDGSNTITTDCGEFNNDTWVGNAESVKFTIGGTSGNRRIQKITVTYGEPKNEDYSLEVTSAGWATLFLDYAVAIPEGVTCYTVSEVGETYATLTKLTDVIPANTAVIVEANEGNYTFEVATEAGSDVANELRGTTVNKYIFEDAYVLGIVDGNVGLYKAEMAGGVWLNNANKAYLPAVAGSANVASYSFRFGEGTTGVEKVEIRNEKSEIYDLTGRRVENLSNGIYIINGVKTLVK